MFQIEQFKTHILKGQFKILQILFYKTMLILKAHILVQTPASYERHKQGSSSWDRFEQTQLSSPKGTKEPFLPTPATLEGQDTSEWEEATSEPKPVLQRADDQYAPVLF